MSVNPYLNIKASSNFQIYEFESVGKVSLRKRAIFDLIDEVEKIYNLALCTVLDNGKLDCDSPSKNGDMDIVLETVAHIAILYNTRFPERKIYFRGSDDIRSRKYQMGVNRNLDILNQTFLIEGLVIDQKENIVVRETFLKGKNYNALIFTRVVD